MRLLLTRAKIVPTYPNGILGIPMDETTQQLALKVNAHLQMLKDLADQQEEAVQVVPSEYTLTIKTEFNSDEHTTEDQVDEKQDEIDDAINISKEAYPRMVSVTPVWDTTEEHTASLLEHLAQLDLVKALLYLIVLSTGCGIYLAEHEKQEKSVQ